jgi:hypothetical protein
MVNHLPRDAEMFGKGRAPPSSVQYEAKSHNVGVRKRIKVVRLSNRYGLRQLHRPRLLPPRIFLKTFILVNKLPAGFLRGGDILGLISGAMGMGPKSPIFL